MKSTHINTVKSKIAHLSLSLLAACIFCGGAAAQNVVTDWNGIAV